jgi:hypothetical protein
MPLSGSFFRILSSQPFHDFSAPLSMKTLKNSLPIGQYDYPKELFFGGQTPSKTQKILAANLSSWIGNASKITHIDFHIDLGNWGTCKLLLDGPSTPETFTRLVQTFGEEQIEAFGSGDTAYQIRGGLGVWCQALMPHCEYDFLTAEFGTYPVIQVLKVLRAENQAHWGAHPGKQYPWAKQQLVKMFAPANQQW